MIIRIHTNTSNVNLTPSVARVVRVYNHRVPSGIPATTLTEAGSMVVAIGPSTESETGAPSADGQVWTSDLSLPRKGSWQAQAGGGGDVDMTNKSGSSRTAGTVVIFDADNDRGVKTTTVRRDRRIAGVLTEDIGNNATGKVAVAGKIATVKVTGSVSRGMWLIASATEEYAEADGYTRPAGAIGICLTQNGTGLESVLISVDHYLGASAGKGYVLGGNTGSVTNVAQIINYITETAALTAGANLSSSRKGASGLSDTSKGYALGGTTGSYVATGDKVTYSTNTTAAAASSNLSAARAYATGVSNRGTKGYSLGGYAGSNVATGDKTTYSTDTTAATASSNLSVARRALAGTNGATKGYASGGLTASEVATADKITYSTDTTAAVSSANLSVARSAPAGFSDETATAYVAGGYTGSYSVVTDKTPYSTDTTAAVSGANISTAREGLAGHESALNGFVSGGDNGSFLTITDKMPFSTETTAVLSSASLPTAVKYSTTCSSFA